MSRLPPLDPRPMHPRVRADALDDGKRCVVPPGQRLPLAPGLLAGDEVDHARPAGPQLLFGQPAIAGPSRSAVAAPPAPRRRPTPPRGCAASTSASRSWRPSPPGPQRSDRPSWTCPHRSTPRPRPTTDRRPPPNSDSSKLAGARGPAVYRLVMVPPALVTDLAAGDTIDVVWRNELGGVTYRLGDRYLKWNPHDTGIDLDHERHRLGWARGRSPSRAAGARPRPRRHRPVADHRGAGRRLSGQPNTGNATPSRP